MGVMVRPFVTGIVVQWLVMVVLGVAVLLVVLSSGWISVRTDMLAAMGGRLIAVVGGDTSRAVLTAVGFVSVVFALLLLV